MWINYTLFSVLGANFLFKTFETLYLSNYHFQAVVLAINLILWSGTMLQKKSTTFTCPLKGIELFWWCWCRFPIWRVSSLFNLQHVHRKQIQKLDACFQQKLGYVFVFCQYIKDPKNLNLVRYFILCSQKIRFGFWSYSKLLQMKSDGRKNSAHKHKLFSPQDSYKGEQRWKKIFTVSTFL